MLKNALMSDVQDLRDNPTKIILLRKLKRAVEDLGTMAGVGRLTHG
jgi:hypothetical protein